MDTLNASDARSRLPELLDACAGEGARFTIAVHGVAKAVLLSAAEWEEIEETLRVLSSPDLLRQINESEAALREGEARDAADVLRDLLADEAA